MVLVRGFVRHRPSESTPSRTGREHKSGKIGATSSSREICPRSTQIIIATVVISFEREANP
jgi:hypothetical protein